MDSLGSAFAPTLLLFYTIDYLAPRGIPDEFFHEDRDLLKLFKSYIEVFYV